MCCMLWYVTGVVGLQCQHIQYHLVEGGLFYHLYWVMLWTLQHCWPHPHSTYLLPPRLICPLGRNWPPHLQVLNWSVPLLSWPYLCHSRGYWPPYGLFGKHILLSYVTSWKIQMQQPRPHLCTFCSPLTPHSYPLHIHHWNYLSKFVSKLSFFFLLHPIE